MLKTLWYKYSHITENCAMVKLMCRVRYYLHQKERPPAMSYVMYEDVIM